MGTKVYFSVAVLVCALLLAVTSVDAASRHKRLVVEPVSTADCDQLRQAVVTFGLPFVEAEALKRGRTKSQVRRARIYCK